MNLKTRISAAYSMLEMLISVAILAIIMGTVMETLIATKGVFGASDTEYGLELEARRLLKVITKDLNSAAWYIPMDTPDKFDLLDGDMDRKLRYYPYINIQTDDGMGERFQHYRRTNTVTRDSFDAIGVQPPNEHKLYSKEIVFVKFARNAPTDDESKTDLTPVSFDLTPTVLFSEYWKGPIISEMEMFLDPTKDERVVGSIDLNGEKNLSGDLREFSYGVRYNKEMRKHELCRYYVERDDNMQGDTNRVPTAEVLSQFVDRVTFDTCRTHFALEVDQIRVQIWLSNRSTGRTVTHKASMTIAMRSNVDPEYTQQIDAWLGTPGNYPVNP